MKRTLLFGTMLCAALTAAGCATTRSSQSDLAAQNSRISQLESQLQSKDQELSRLQGQLSQQQSELSGQRDALARAQAEKDALSRKLDNAQDDLRTLKAAKPVSSDEQYLK